MSDTLKIISLPLVTFFFIIFGPRLNFTKWYDSNSCKKNVTEKLIFINDVQYM